MSAFQDSLKATGKLNVKHLAEDGSLINEYNFENLVVTTGLTYIAARMADTGTPTQMTYMGLGAGVAAPALADTALGSPLGSRVTLTTAGGTPSGTKVTYQATFPAGTGTGAVTEAGVFSASTSGTMLCRTTFSVINKGAADSIAVTWDVTIA